MRIRSKLLALIAIPLIALTLAAGFGFANQSAAIETAEESSRTLQEAEAVHMAALAVGNERLEALGIDVGRESELQVQTDTAFEQLTAALSSEPDKLSVIQSSETLVAEARADAANDINLFVEANSLLSSLDSDAAASYPNAVARNSITVNRTAIWALEAKEVAWIRYIQAQDGVAVSESDIITAFTTASNRFATAAQLSRENESTAIDSLLLTDSSIRLQEFETLALADLADPEQTEFSLDQVAISSALSEFRPEFVSTIMALDVELNTLINGELDSANGLRSLFTLLAIVGVVVLTGLIFVIYRSITNPLESLLGQASSVANVELPNLVQALRTDDGEGDLPVATPIPVTSSDEIGELVEAFNDVQRTAYDLATEQALGRRNVSDMFINLGRRNQQLLQRILAQLTKLEQEEEDPDKLRGLFELDNIVTRMRRNAESLLALAGAQTSRQWSQPIAIENTVRAAFGEVEGYERIDVANLAEVKVTGSVVADITHLLAELLENALKYSEPHTSVEVNGQMGRDGYIITVTDRGIGMSQRELGDNNSRITDPPPLDQVPTKFLGLYVVGRLAERHNIDVMLTEASTGGIAARVVLPESILASERPQAEDVAELPIRKADQEEEQSPLEEDHDLDAELVELTTGEPSDEFSDDEPSDDGDHLPVRKKSSSKSDKTTDSAAEEDAPSAMAYASVIEAPTDEDEETEESEDTSEAAQIEVDEDTETDADADAEAEAETDEEPESADTGGLPVRGRKQRPNPKKAARAKKRAEQAKSDPTEDRSSKSSSKPEAKAEPKDPEIETVEAQQPDASSPQEIEGLPVRSKGRSLQDVPDAVVERATVADRAATDTSTEAASGFSSMMSALNSGISRGLDEKDSEETMEGNDQ